LVAADRHSSFLLLHADRELTARLKARTSALLMLYMTHFTSREIARGYQATSADVRLRGTRITITSAFDPKRTLGPRFQNISGQTQGLAGLSAAALRVR